MNVENFIKVTPKNGGKPVVMLARNKEFYLAQGATIERPTEKEVIEHFPEYQEQEGHSDDVEALQKKVAELTAENEDLKESGKVLVEQVDALQKKVAELTADKGKK